VCVRGVWGFGRCWPCVCMYMCHVLMRTHSCALAYAHVPQASAARFEDNALSATCGSSQGTRGPRVWAVGVMVAVGMAMGRAVWIVACVCLHLLSLSILAVGLAVLLCLFVCLNMYACRYYVYAYILMRICYSLLTIYLSIICIDPQSVGPQPL
jgi:hypothetical protein